MVSCRPAYMLDLAACDELKPMSQSDQNDPSASEDPGIFSGLPRSRPGVRSPSRGDASAAESPTRKVAASAGGPAQSPPPGPLAADAPNELEELAKLSVNAASQVAAAGLRIAGRAAGALRGAVERR